MKPKKTPKADLEGKKFIFTQIGLVIALVLVLAAFSYKSYDKRELQDHMRIVDDTPEEMIPITTQNQPPPPPPPPAPKVTVINEVKDDIEVEDVEIEDVEADDETVIEDVAPIEVEEEEPLEAEIFTVVEENPEFPGGIPALMKYLSSNIKYPVMAKEAGIQGKVYLNFVVEPTGSISGIKILRGIGGGCDEEAMRVVAAMPKWKPGKQRGKAVRVSYNLPVKFTLN
ncbi:MAG: energy transducer TonB [Bacteroidales bacterium]